MRNQICLLAVIMAASSRWLCASEYEWSASDSTVEFKSGDYRLWIPDDLKQIRAIIVRQHGCGRNGIDHADDLQWQALAEKHGAALLGTHYVTNKNCAEWSDPEKGSEKTFLAALKFFAEKSQHPELVWAPWALWGHSGGAYWSVALVRKFPDRVIAIWARSGGRAGFDDNEIFNVPIVFNFGTKERTDRFQKITEDSTACLTEGRAKKAVWAIAEDPKSSHDCRNSRLLAIPFFDAVLAARLPSVASTSELPKLIKLKYADGWLGDLKTFEIAPLAKFTGNAAQAAWLPNEAVAQQWQEYCKSGEVVDKTPPPPPANVSLMKNSDNEIVLTWSGPVDLESGIKQYQILRNGELLATVGGEKTKANSKELVQVWNYGDEPEPRLVPRTFTDAKPIENGRYAIKAVNHAGLISIEAAAK